MRYGPTTVTLKPFGGRRMLDVGCGAGYHMADMRNLGWDVYGVDFNCQAVEAANAALGDKRVWLGTLSDVPESVADLDLVTMHHLLEHVPNPRETLQETHRRLHPQGRIHVIVPNIASREALIFGRYWVPVDAPRHLNHFTESSLSSILYESGFEVQRIRPQFLPWMIRASFNRAVDLGLGPRWKWLKWIVYPAHLAVSPLSYLAGNIGVLDVLATKRP
ncbi:MAG: class I SAM-dependent methyltransferase [Dehalococcoidia bacterium]